MASMGTCEKGSLLSPVACAMTPLGSHVVLNICGVGSAGLVGLMNIYGALVGGVFEVGVYSSLEFKKMNVSVDKALSKLVLEDASFTLTEVTQETWINPKLSPLRKEGSLEARAESRSDPPAATEAQDWPVHTGSVVARSEPTGRAIVGGGSCRFRGELEAMAVGERVGD
ncbi:hypothetical protein SUGI_1119490 [Cryptomeria japonica]|nr:hypothetical protein SUGI_1119490 [Cryptomeria japonica]